MQFINFTKAFEKRAVYTSLNWGSILALLIGSYSHADCDMALKTNDALPSAAGSAATKKALKGLVYSEHYKHTGQSRTAWARSQPQ